MNNKSVHRAEQKKKYTNRMQTNSQRKTRKTVKCIAYGNCGKIQIKWN